MLHPKETAELNEEKFVSTKVSFTMNDDVRFGAAENNTVLPWLVYINYVKKVTASRDYIFNVNKK